MILVFELYLEYPDSKSDNFGTVAILKKRAIFPWLFCEYFSFINYVATQSHGYRDTTATYIRRAMVPSHMYAKHQNNTGIRVRKYVVIYIPTQKYKYSVITGCDIILHKYYITR